MKPRRVRLDRIPIPHPTHPLISAQNHDQETQSDTENNTQREDKGIHRDVVSRIDCGGRKDEKSEEEEGG